MNLSRDILHAARRLRATPVFAMFAIATGGVGIGLATTTGAIVQAACAPPSGVREYDSLVNIYHAPGSRPRIALSLEDYRDFELQQDVFGTLAAWRQFRHIVSSNAGTEVASGELVTGRYFDLLRIAPWSGRLLALSDDQPGAEPVAVVSERLWRRVRQAPDLSVTPAIWLNRHRFVIVGVAPPSFRGLFNNGRVPTDLWIPVTNARLLATADLGFRTESAGREYRWLQAKGRLRPGVTLHAAQAQVAAIAAQLDEAVPLRSTAGSSTHRETRQWTIRLAKDVRLNESADLIIGPLLASVVSVVAMVLVLVSIALMNLFVGRFWYRQDDYSVRLALGASRWDLIRMNVAETGLVVSAGGVLGLLACQSFFYWFGSEITTRSGAYVLVDRIMSPAVLALAAGSTVIALVLSGAGPVVQVLRLELRRSTIGVGSTATRRWRGMRAFVAFQVAVSAVLLAATASAVDETRTVELRDRGLDVGRLVVAEVDIGGPGADRQAVIAAIKSARQRILRAPGVRSVSASSALPFGPAGTTATVAANGESVGVSLIAAEPDLLDTLGIKILRGESFAEATDQDLESVAVVSHQVAERLFGHIDVVGQRVEVRGPGPKASAGVSLVTIVGVVADTSSNSVVDRNPLAVYVPLGWHTGSKLLLAGRITGDPGRALSDLRASLDAVGPSVQIARLQTGPEYAGQVSLFLQVAAWLAGLLGTLGLLMATVGLYGVVSQMVESRRKEIAVRMTVGAKSTQIVLLVLRDGLAPIAGGLLLAIPVSVLSEVWLWPFLGPLMPTTSWGDFLPVTASVLVAGMAACYLPVQLAVTTEPIRELRAV